MNSLCDDVFVANEKGLKHRSVVFCSLRETVFKMVMGDITASEFGEKFAKIAKRSRGRQYSRVGLNFNTNYLECLMLKITPLGPLPGRPFH